jgi:hypothetical protein
MRFASSRLLASAVLTLGFLAHASCGGKVDVNFVGADAASGGSSSSGGASGGKSSTGGKSSSGGTGADSSGGTGADSSGGTGNTSSGGTGNTSSGGTTSGGTTGCDPDTCNGPMLLSAFPEYGKAAAGADVELVFEEPNVDGAEFQCRVAKPNEIDGTPWFGCGGPVVKPISDIDSADPAHDGLKAVQVRFKFPDNTLSDSSEWRFYTHHSMHGMARCDAAATDEAYFEAAAAHLPAAGAFGTSAALDNPFILIDFDPPEDLRAYVEVASGDGTVKPLSLRRRFVKDSSDQYLLMSRVYESRTYPGRCRVATIFVHNVTSFNNTTEHVPCNGIVFNKVGAGVCLQASGGAVSLAYQNNTTWFDAPMYAPDADNLMWRELIRTMPNDGLPKYFSDKCFSDPSCVDGDEYRLYLPDVTLFD